MKVLEVGLLLGERWVLLHERSPKARLEERPQGIPRKRRIGDNC
jgi:hypothetical protein